VYLDRGLTEILDYQDSDIEPGSYNQLGVIVLSKADVCTILDQKIGQFADEVGGTD